MGVARSIPARAGKPDASRGAVATYYGRLGGGPSVYEPLGGFPLIAAISRPSMSFRSWRARPEPRMSVT